jgi:type III secretory pathway component EscU
MEKMEKFMHKLPILTHLVQTRHLLEHALDVIVVASDFGRFWYVYQAFNFGYRKVNPFLARKYLTSLRSVLLYKGL